MKNKFIAGILFLLPVFSHASENQYGFTSSFKTNIPKGECMFGDNDSKHVITFSNQVQSVGRICNVYDVKNHTFSFSHFNVTHPDLSYEIKTKVYDANKLISSSSLFTQSYLNTPYQVTDTVRNSVRKMVVNVQGKLVTVSQQVDASVGFTGSFFLIPTDNNSLAVYMGYDFSELLKDNQVTNHPDVISSIVKNGEKIDLQLAPNKHAELTISWTSP